MDPEQREIWTKFQTENAAKIIREDEIYIIKYIASFHLSYNEDVETDDDKEYAKLTVIDYFTKETVYSDSIVINFDKVDFNDEYLGFREIPFYSALFCRLLQQKRQFFPQIMIVDGFGILHQRKFGSASHFGFALDIPTIGISNKLLVINGIDESRIKAVFATIKAGNYIKIVGSSGETYGAALKSTDSSARPIYVTIGHKISLATAISIVNEICEY